MSEELQRLLDNSTERKKRLFAIAMVRSRADPLEGDGREMVEKAELYADGHLDEDELNASLMKNTRSLAHWVAPITGLNTYDSDPVGYVINHLVWKLYSPWQSLSLPLAREVLTRHPPLRSGPTSYGLATAAYEHRLADDGTLDPVRLSILADALEEEGCPQDVVEHLRGVGPCNEPHCWGDGWTDAAGGFPVHCGCFETPGRGPLRSKHYRGCWALDLVLGKE